ncbi:hypothetical protein BJX99DRAFT_256475 [Aspergillus californicus]
MATRKPTPSTDDSSQNKVRKRVCKACDRCRLKKSKCDGANPCSRCRADNSICIFRLRKRIAEKLYPGGYAELLEQQQAWLVHGFQELYRRVTVSEGWPGDRLSQEPSGHPLTHDLLACLGALDPSKGERFEENLESLQKGLWDREPSNGGFEDVQPPVHRPPVIPEFPPQQTASSPVPAYSNLSNESWIKDIEEHSTPSIQGFVDPLDLQVRLGKWEGNSEFPLLDERDMMITADCPNTVIHEPVPYISCPIFNDQMSMDCNGYEDLCQIFNPDSTEFTSI